MREITDINDGCTQIACGAAHGLWKRTSRILDGRITHCGRPGSHGYCMNRDARSARLRGHCRVGVWWRRWKGSADQCSAETDAVVRVCQIGSALSVAVSSLTDGGNNVEGPQRVHEDRRCCDCSGGCCVGRNAGRRSNGDGWAVKGVKALAYDAAFPDVKPGLESLRKQGVKLAILPKMLEAAAKSATFSTTSSASTK
jgi:hypothetical protein